MVEAALGGVGSGHLTSQSRIPGTDSYATMSASTFPSFRSVPRGHWRQMTLIDVPAPLVGLRESVREHSPLPALTNERYALTHARYEAASDQRRRLRDWLVAELPPLLGDCDPVRVVGV